MKNNTVLLLCFFLLLSSCLKPDRKLKEKRINNYIQTRIESHTKLKQEICIDNIEKAAKRAVDKYIKENEELILGRPRIKSLPAKPNYPIRKYIQDSLEVKPIFTLEEDSLHSQ